MTAPSLTVQAQDGAVLIEDHDRNLSVLALLEPLHVTCPFDGQRWCFHTQEQADMFQEHLKRHATESATLKAREAATIATVNAAWADTVAALTTERDGLKATVERLKAPIRDAEYIQHVHMMKLGNAPCLGLRLSSVEKLLADRTTPPKEGQSK